MASSCHYDAARSEGRKPTNLQRPTNRQSVTASTQSRPCLDVAPRQHIERRHISPQSSGAPRKTGPVIPVPVFSKTTTTNSRVLHARKDNSQSQITRIPKLYVDEPASRGRSSRSDKNPPFPSSSVGLPSSPKSLLHQDSSTDKQHAVRTGRQSDYSQHRSDMISSTGQAAEADAFTSVALRTDSSSTSTLANKNNNGGVDENIRYHVPVTAVEFSRFPVLQHISTLPDSSVASSSRCSESPFSLLSTPTSISSYSPVVPSRPSLERHRHSISPVEDRPFMVPRAHKQQQHVSTERSNGPKSDMSRCVADSSAENVSRKKKDSKAVSRTELHDARRINSSSLPHAPRAGIVGQSVAHELGDKTNQPPTEVQLCQVPPELVHLNVDSPIAPFAGRPIPRRPSRDNTDDLSGHQDPSFVIQSNMPSIDAISQRAITPLASPVSTRSPSVSSWRRFGFRSRSSSRQQTPVVDSVTSPSGSPSMFSDEEWGSVDGHSIRQDSPMTGDSSSFAKSSRPRVHPEQPKDEQTIIGRPERKQRRGPAAGTGHEGYRKFGFRGRSSSFFGSSFKRSPSADSGTSVKSSSVFSWMSRRSSDGESSSIAEPLEERRQATPIHHDDGAAHIPDSLQGDSTYEVFISSQPPISSGASMRERSRSRTASRKPKDTGVDDGSQSDDNALRGSSRSKKMRSQKPSGKVPEHSFNEGKEGKWLRPMKKGNTKDKGKSYNFAERLLADTTGYDHTNTKGTASSRNAAHHALARITNSVSPQEIKAVAASEGHVQSKKATRHDGLPNATSPVPYEPRHEGYLPRLPSSPEGTKALSKSPFPSSARPIVSSASRDLSSHKAVTTTNAPVAGISTNPAALSASPHRTLRSRLSSVGRIPHVVFKKDGDQALPYDARHQPSADVEPPPVPQSTMAFNSIATNSPAILLAQSDVGKQSDRNEFIAFPPRKNSELSYTSSSSDGPNPAHVDNEELPDDSWSEYNVLCDENMPLRTATSTQIPDKTQTVNINATRHSRFPSDGSQHLEKRAHLRNDHNHYTDQGQQHYNDLSDKQSRVEIPEDQSKTPVTPFSISDYLIEGDRASKASERLARRSAPDLGDQTRVPEQRSVVSASTQSLAERMMESTGIFPEAGPDMVPVDPMMTVQDAEASKTAQRAQKASRKVTGEFRHAALVTSKWLSFGRVLFSPAHKDAEAGGDTRVLVLDGLGKGKYFTMDATGHTNVASEWSYYCALTYPNCQFYHLGPEASTPASDRVPNHRHIHHSSMSATFPFPRSFFSAVVLRFPQVTSDAAYQACMSEIKRTLHPGGFLELSTLDLDLVNMGSLSRKAVKDLKVRLHQTNTQFSLWNQGDAFLKLVGRKGFENLQRCVVALPAAGKIRLSRDLNNSSQSSVSLETAPSPAGEAESPGLVDLLHSRTDDGHMDEKIAKTVAKVGRWWYSTCYEEAIASPEETDDVSIWDTPGLLREMERQGTSFRLLICYAQKPTVTKRRTASV